MLHVRTQFQSSVDEVHVAYLLRTHQFVSKVKCKSGTTEKSIATRCLTIEELSRETSEPLRVQKQDIRNRTVEKGKVISRELRL
jgi:hypothetical protein